MGPCIFQSAILDNIIVFPLNFRTVKYADSIAGWLQTAFVYTAMVDYPTPANLMKNLPAYPVKEVLHFTHAPPTLLSFQQICQTEPSICMNKNCTSVVLNMLFLTKTNPDVQDHRWVPRKCGHPGKGVRSGELVL
jgi:hypothetical protein